MAAQITINQPTGAGSGTPGESRIDIWLDQAVVLVSSGSGSTYLWEMLDRPPASTATLSTPTGSTSGFTPDKVGTYRIRLTVDGGGSGNISTRIVRARYSVDGVLTKRGWVLPAVGENDNEDNHSGNLRGWAPSIEPIISQTNAALTTLVFQPGGGVDEGHVFETWSVLMETFNGIVGPVIIRVDDQFASAVIPTGHWDLKRQGLLVGANTSTRTELQLADAVLINDPAGFRHLDVVVTGTNAGVFSLGAGTFCSIEDSNFTNSSSTSHILDVSEARVTIRGTSTFSTTAQPVVSFSGSSAELWLEGASVIEEGCLGGSPSLGVTVNLVGVSTFCSPEQTGFSGTLTINVVQQTVGRRWVYTLSKGKYTESTGTPVVVGAVYIDPEEIPLYAFWSSLDPTAKYRVVMETTAALQAATMDLYDVNGVFNSGTPAPITGSQQDTATGTGPSRPGGGTPLTPSPTVASAYEVDITSTIFGGTWSSPGVYEARLWIASSGGGNAATCKSAELIIEW